MRIKQMMRVALSLCGEACNAAVDFSLNVIFFVSDFRHGLSGIASTKASQTILILGNGPSLKASLLEDQGILSRVDCMAVNKFALSDQFVTIRPSLYCLLDPLFFSSEEDLARSGCEKHVVQEIVNTKIAIRDKVEWPMVMLIPASSPMNDTLLMDATTANKNISVLRYYIRNFKGATSHLFLRSTRGIIGGQNVLHACLSISIHMGYKKVLIVGGDHSWHENLKYDARKQEIYLDDAHFDKTVRRYFSDMKFSMAYQMLCLAKFFEPYPLIKKWAERRGVVIKNCSSYSFIDEFGYSTLRRELE